MNSENIDGITYYQRLEDQRVEQFGCTQCFAKDHLSNLIRHIIHHHNNSVLAMMLTALIDGRIKPRVVDQVDDK